MDSNIFDLDDSNNNLENYSHADIVLKLNKIFKLFLKFSAYTIGILILGIFVNDLGQKIIRTYSDSDSLENFRNLEKALEQEEENLIRKTKLDGSRYLKENIGFNEDQIVDKNEILDSTQDGTYTEEISSANINEDNEAEFMKFYSYANMITYKGNWHSEVSNQYLENRNKGEIALKIERYFNKVTSSERIFVTFRMLDGNVLDKWIIVKSINFPFVNTTVTNTSLTQSFLSIVEFGEIFDTNDVIYSMWNYIIYRL